jgi:hypothetical protein
MLSKQPKLIARLPFQDPFKAFTLNVNTCGTLLQEAQCQVVADEIPLATAFSMQLVECLAHTD